MEWNELILGLVITAVSYGLGPMILAFAMKRKIRKRTLVLFCVIYTIAIHFGWVALNRAASQGEYVFTNSTPALLWGFVFYGVAKRHMKRNGRLMEKRCSGQATEEGLNALAHLGDQKADEVKKRTAPPVVSAHLKKGAEDENAVDLLVRLQEECKKEQTLAEPAGQPSISGKWKFLCLILVVICVSLGAACIHLGQKAAEFERESEKNNLLIEYYQDRIAFLQDKVRNYESAVLESKKNYTVAVSTEGERTYHSLDCTLIDGKPHYKLSEYSAVLMGYRPCEVCCSQG